MSNFKCFEFKVFVFKKFSGDLPFIIAFAE
jgi:hypothetical protein